jgi:hypothetical protein
VELEVGQYDETGSWNVTILKEPISIKYFQSVRNLNEMSIHLDISNIHEDSLIIFTSSSEEVKMTEYFILNFFGELMNEVTSDKTRYKFKII